MAQNHDLILAGTQDRCADIGVEQITVEMPIVLDIHEADPLVNADEASASGVQHREQRAPSGAIDILDIAHPGSGGVLDSSDAAIQRELDRPDHAVRIDANQADLCICISRNLQKPAPTFGQGREAIFCGECVETNKLLASRMSVEEMAEFIRVDSLAFLSIDGLYRAVGEAARDNDQPQFCDACFTGNYPVPVQLELSKLALEKPGPAAD